MAVGSAKVSASAAANASGVAGRAEERLVLVADDLGDAVDRRGDHRHPGQRRLGRDQPGGLLPDRGDDDRVHGGEQLGKAGGVAGAEQLDPVADAEPGGQLAQLGEEVVEARPGDQEPGADAVLLGQERCRPHRDVGALVGGDAADEADRDLLRRPPRESDEALALERRRQRHPLDRRGDPVRHQGQPPQRLAVPGDRRGQLRPRLKLSGGSLSTAFISAPRAPPPRRPAMNVSPS